MSLNKDSTKQALKVSIEAGDVDGQVKKIPSSTSSENDIKNNARPDHIRISLDNSLIYFHDHIVDVNLVNVQFSILAIGTHELKVQVGEYNTTTKDEDIWNITTFTYLFSNFA